MNREAATNQPNTPCPDWQPLLMLSAAGGELEDAEHDRLTAHLAQCPTCAESLEHEKELLALLSANHVEPDATLLASCRAGLTDALDREEEGGWLRRALGRLLPARLAYAAPRMERGCASVDRLQRRSFGAPPSPPSRKFSGSRQFQSGDRSDE